VIHNPEEASSAPGANNATVIKRGVLPITPGDVTSSCCGQRQHRRTPELAGIILTGIRPSDNLKIIRTLPFPVLVLRRQLPRRPRVHDLDGQDPPMTRGRFQMIRDLVAEHVDVNKILKAL
jgi:hypothetical protein